MADINEQLVISNEQLEMNNETKKGKMVPELRFPGFDGVWEEKKLGAFGPIVTGSTPSRQNTLYWNGNFCWVSAQDMKEKYIYDTKEKVTEDGMKRCRLLPKNSVLVTCIASIGLNSITKVECATNQQINAIIAKNELEAEFIYQSIERYTPLLKALAGQTAVPIVNKQQFCDFEIPTPSSLPEQQKIAECLSSVDDLIQAEADQLQALKDHKKGLMQQLFPQEGETTPKLRFPGFEGEWEEKKLGEVCNVVDDKCDIGSLTIVTYISTENMLQDFEGVKIASKLPNSGSFTRFNKGDILFSNIRPYLRKVWQAVFDGAASNDVIVFRTLDGYDRLFVSQVIKSDRFIAHSMSGAKGVKMPRGDKKMMLDYLFSIPSLPEQQKIASCLSSLDEGIAAQQEKVETLKEHKKGLMQKLFPTIN